MARNLDERWFSLLKQYQNNIFIADIILKIKNNSVYYKAFKNFTGKTIEEALQ